MSELFNGDPKNDEAMREELLGDDDLFTVCRRTIDEYGKEFVAKFFRTLVEVVRPGLFRRTKDGPVLLEAR